MIPEKPSSTAKLIAAATILLASEADDNNPVPPRATQLCHLFLSNHFTDRTLARSASFPPTRKLLRLIETATLTGIIHHYWNRKRWIENECLAALNDGFKRVVILGAGFDTLGIRLSEKFNEIEIIEIDHPATQKAKLNALTNSPPPRVKFIPLDLTHQTLDLESSNPLPTLYIMEGLLMYLELKTVTRLFHEIHSQPNPHNRIIFSFMTKWPDGTTEFRPASQLVKHWLKWRKEPFLWSMEPIAIPTFVEAHGFRFLKTVLTKNLTTNTSSLDGENLSICET